MHRTLPFFVMLFVSSFAKADLIFTTPPRGNEAEDRAVYEPIAEAMSGWLGTKVVYEYPKDFTSYSFRMREGRYDIVFDGAHFAEWRVKNKGHEILVHLPEKLVFLVVASTSEKSVTNLESLIAKKVCAQAPPQLGTLFLMAQYTSPAREPIIDAVENEYQLNDAVKTGKCPVAILRDKAFYKMSDEERSKFRIIYSSRPVPNVTFSVSRKLTAAQKKVLVDNLTNTRTAVVAKDVFAKLSKGATRFEPANASDYQDLDVLLTNFSYGW